MIGRIAAFTTTIVAGSLLFATPSPVTAGAPVAVGDSVVTHAAHRDVGDAGAGDVVGHARRTRFYVGMWTSHVRYPGHGLDTNSLIGVAYRGYFGGTFINSYGDRAVAAGIQRNITSPRQSTIATALGYRAGLVTGYDERFLPIAARTPVIPFMQVVGSIDYSRLGVELAYAGLTTSVLVSFRL